MESVAKRYALALLSIAKEENNLQEYLDQVSKIITILQENEDLLTLLASFGVSNDEKKSCLQTIFENKINEYILNLFYVLVDNKRANYLLDVCDEFINLGLNELNIKKGIVFSTIKLTNDQISRLNAKLSKMLQANVLLENKIDESLIGGFKIQIADYILDDSLKKRLADLKETLTS